MANSKIPKNPPAPMTLSDIGEDLRPLADKYVNAVPDHSEQQRFLRLLGGTSDKIDLAISSARQQIRGVPTQQRSGSYAGPLVISAVQRFVDKLRTYNPSRLSYSEIDTMKRVEPMITLGFGTWSAILKGAGYYIECDDPVQRKFLTEEIEDNWPGIVGPIVDGGLDYGHSAVNIWWTRARRIYYDDGDSGNPSDSRVIADRRFHVIRELIDMHPKSFTVKVDERGSFLGVAQRDPNDPMKWKTIKDGYHLAFSGFNQRYGNWYGESLAVPAFTQYYLKQIYQYLAAQWHERQGAGHLVVTHPDEPKVKVVQDEEEVEVWTQDRALQLVAALRSLAVSALPYVPGENGENQWKFEYIQAPERGGMWSVPLLYYDQQMLRAMLFPDRTVQQDNKGTSAGAEVSQGTFMMITGDKLRAVEDAINKNYVVPLIRANFSPEKVRRVRLRFYPQNVDRTSIMKQIFQEFMRQWPNFMAAGLFPQLSIAFKDVATALGIPLSATGDEFKDMMRATADDKRARRKQREDVSEARKYAEWMAQCPAFKDQNFLIEGS